MLPSLMTPITTYQDYFFRYQFNPYEDRYVKALNPYLINVMNHSAALITRDLGHHIFAATNGIYPTELLLWIATPGVDSATDPRFLTLQQTVSQYAHHARHGSSPWDREVFSYCVGASHGSMTILN